MPAAGALLGCAIGVMLGLLHFASLWWNTRLYLHGGAVRAFAIQFARFAMLLAVLAGLAKLGALPLLSGALGLLLARALVMRHVRRSA